MKKILILLLATVILCGCTNEPSANTPETTAEPNKDPLDSYPTMMSEAAFWFKKLNAVVVTWGEPIPEENSDDNETVTADDLINSKFIDWIKVRVTYNQVYYSSFRTHFSTSKSLIREALGEYILVPKKLIDLFPAGKTQLVFVDRNVEGVLLRASKDKNGTILLLRPIFDIVDERIVFPDDFEEHYISFWIKIANQHLRWLGDCSSFFEDGMPISDLGAYIDNVISYEGTKFQQ